MAQEYHNWITVRANAAIRKQIAIHILAMAPAQWDWVGLTLNCAAQSGGDSGESVLEFYSHGSPMGLDELSIAFPEIDFRFRLFDLSFPKVYLVTMKHGTVVEEREEYPEFSDRVEQPEVDLAVVRDRVGRLVTLANDLASAINPLKEDAR